MAEKKNFTIENFNGTDYDTLYPETNSGQVLLDTTAQAATTLQSGSTLNDALNKLNKFDNRYEIGDVLTTSRTDLSDKWLLCNGATLDSAEYPELGAQFPGTEMHFDKISENNSPTSTINYSIAARKLNNGDTELLMTIGNKLLRKNLATPDDWALIGTMDNIYIVYCLNNNFILIPITDVRTIPQVRAKYCTGTPTSFNDFQNLQIPSSLPQYAKFVDVKWYNGKYYFGIQGDLYLQVWIYDDLSSSPTVASFDIGNFSTGHGVLGVADGRVVTSYTKYEGTSGDDGQYSLAFVGINSDGSTVTISSSYGASPSTHSPVPTAIWSFGGKYYYISCGANAPMSYVYLNVAQANSLTATAQHIKSISTNSKSGTRSNPWATYMVLDNAIMLPDKTYIDSSNNVKNWENSSSISQSQCMSFSQTDTFIYTMCPQYEVWRSSKSAQFNLPTYSPATGLRAYIKAKN